MTEGLGGVFDGLAKDGRGELRGLARGEVVGSGSAKECGCREGPDEENNDRDKRCNIGGLVLARGLCCTAELEGGSAVGVRGKEVDDADGVSRNKERVLAALDGSAVAGRCLRGKGGVGESIAVSTAWCGVFNRSDLLLDSPRACRMGCGCGD